MIDSTTLERPKTTAPFKGVLTARPVYTLLPDTDQVSDMRNGRIRIGSLSRCGLPASVISWTMVAPGPMTPDVEAVLPSLAAHAWRMVAWVRVQVVGTLPMRTNQWGGAFWSDDLTLISGGRHAVGLTTVLCHEILHMVWRGHLSE